MQSFVRRITPGETVTRYVVTIRNKEGERTLFDHQQGQYTFRTREEAQRRCDAFRQGDPHSREVLAEIYGPGAAESLEVRPCECYPGHYDPIGIYFD